MMHCVGAHPLCHGHHHGLPRVLWYQPPSPSVLLVTFEERCGEFVVDASTIDAAPEYEVVSSPRMVCTRAIGGKRTTKVRLSHQHSRVKDILPFEFCYEIPQSVVNLSKFAVENVIDVAMRIETSHLNIKEVSLHFALGPSH